MLLAVAPKLCCGRSIHLGGGLRWIRGSAGAESKDDKGPKDRVYAAARRAAQRIYQGKLQGSLVMEAAKEARLDVGVRSMNVLMHELGRLNDCDGAVEAFKAFRAASVEPNQRACTTLIFILGRARRLNEARQIFHWALQRELLSPDLFHTFIIACAKCRDPAAAAKAFAELERREMEPGKAAYMGLVSAFLSAGEPDKAKSWLAKMRSRGLLPGPADYQAMLCACARGRRAREASDIFQEMQELGMQPSSVSYNALLSTYDRCGLWRDALRVLLHMRNPSEIAWSIALSACARGGQVRIAAEIMSRMQAAGRVPGVVAWSCLVEAHRRAGDRKGAEGAVAAMAAAGMQPNEVTWGSLLAGYAAAGETDRVGWALGKVARPGIVLWTSAIAGADGVEAAQVLFRRMVASGCKPNVATYTALMQVCGRAGEWSQAEEAFRAMVQAGLRPNAVACGSLLRAYAKARQLGRAGALFRRMKPEYGVLPDRFAYTALIHACFLTRDWQHAEALFRHMQAARVAPDGVLFQELLRTYEATGQVDKSIRLMEIMANTMS